MSVARNVKRSIVYLMIIAVAFCLIPLIGSVGQAHAASALQVNKIAVKPAKCDLAGKDAQATIKATVTFNKKVTKANAQKLVSVTTSNKGSVSIAKKTFKVSKKTATVSIKVKAVKDNCSAVIKVKAKKGKSAAKKGKSIKVSVYEPAESVFVNGKVYTVEGEGWEDEAAEAIAVDADGKILGVGTTKAIEAKFKGAATNSVDLEGKTVFPGFIDSHCHSPGPAFTQVYEINLAGVFAKAETIKIIKDFVDAHPEMDAYFGSGYSNVMKDENGVDVAVHKDWLDAICPDKPIVLTSFDFHQRWLNSKALEVCGITETTPDPPGGLIRKDPETGELTGVLTDASGLVTIRAEYTEEQNQAAFDWFFERMNSWGYTGWSDAGTATGYAPMLKERSIANGGLPMRVNYAGMLDAEDIDGSLQRTDALKAMIGDTKDMSVTAIKIFGDGVVEGGTAYLWEPYKQPALLNLFNRTETDWVGKPKLSQEQLDEATLKANARGYNIHVHAIGDQMTTMVLDAVAKAKTQLKDDNCRNIITHLQVVDQDDIYRFKQLGVIAQCQVFWHFKAPDMYWPIEEPLLGKARAAREYPLNSFYQNGVKITASGDYPISPVNNPFWAIEIGVTRNLENAAFYKSSFPDIEEIEDMDEPKYLLNPNERVPLSAMIEAYTINGAYQMMAEDVCGSLKEGKVADFVIVDVDPFEINPVKLDEVKVLKTYKDGKIVWEE